MISGENQPDQANALSLATMEQLTAALRAAAADALRAVLVTGSGRGAMLALAADLVQSGRRMPASEAQAAADRHKARQL